jgi:tRNA nucleotidyltransferase (CCA-adding enzyme)
MENYQTFLQHRAFSAVAQAAQELKVDAYVIGGFVRDKLLQRQEPKDIDIVTVGSGIKLAEKVAEILKVKNLSIFKNFGTAQVKWKNIELEFVGARKESYQRNSRKPLVENGSLADDQNRRDFTINALALSLNAKDFGQLLDPFNGVEDLNQGLIRTPLAPNQTFSDDPLRMLRAIRFATQLNFTITNQCLEALSQNAARLEIISAERISEELHKIMRSKKPSKGLILLHRTGLLPKFLPEVSALAGVEEIEGQSHKDNFYHTAQVVDNIAENTQNLWLRYAALFHDIGKPPTKKFVKPTGWTFYHHEYVGAKMLPKIFKRLKWPLGKPLRYVKKIVALSSRPQAIVDEQATDSAARRLLFEAGNDIEDLMLLAEADITTRNERKKQGFLNNFKQVRKKLKAVEEKDQVRNFQPPLSGNEIMQLFKLNPGPEIGQIKNAVKEAILEGKIKNNRPEALALAQNIAAELGLPTSEN